MVMAPQANTMKGSKLLGFGMFFLVATELVCTHLVPIILWRPRETCRSNVTGKMLWECSLFLHLFEAPLLGWYVYFGWKCLKVKYKERAHFYALSLVNVVSLFAFLMFQAVFSWRSMLNGAPVHEVVVLCVSSAIVFLVLCLSIIVSLGVLQPTLQEAVRETATSFEETEWREARAWVSRMAVSLFLLVGIQTIVSHLGAVLPSMDKWQTCQRIDGTMLPGCSAFMHLFQIPVCAWYVYFGIRGLKLTFASRGHFYFQAVANCVCLFVFLLFELVLGWFSMTNGHPVSEVFAIWLNFFLVAAALSFNLYVTCFRLQPLIPNDSLGIQLRYAFAIDFSAAANGDQEMRMGASWSDPVSSPWGGLGRSLKSRATSPTSKTFTLASTLNLPRTSHDSGSSGRGVHRQVSADFEGQSLPRQISTDSNRSVLALTPRAKKCVVGGDRSCDEETVDDRAVEAVEGWDDPAVVIRSFLPPEWEEVQRWCGFLAYSLFLLRGLVIMGMHSAVFSPWGTCKAVSTGKVLWECSVFLHLVEIPFFVGTTYYGLCALRLKYETVGTFYVASLAHAACLFVYMVYHALVAWRAMVAESPIYEIFCLWVNLLTLIFLTTLSLHVTLIHLAPIAGAGDPEATPAESESGKSVASDVELMPSGSKVSASSLVPGESRSSRPHESRSTRPHETSERPSLPRPEPLPE